MPALTALEAVAGVVGRADLAWRLAPSRHLYLYAVTKKHAVVIFCDSVVRWLNGIVFLRIGR